MTGVGNQPFVTWMLFKLSKNNTALTPCMQQAYTFQLPSNSHSLQQYLDLPSKIPGVLLLSITTYDLKLFSFSQSKTILTEDIH